MKKLLLLFGFLAALNAYSADVKISQLPLGSASTSSGADSFPFVNASTNVTKRLTLWDIVNIPTLASTYAPKANPTFTGTLTAPTISGGTLTLSGLLAGSTLTTSGTIVSSGTVTAPTFVGALTGNASTATALAANPTDCSAGQYANAIVANGNLTCQAVAASELSGTLAVGKGGTGLTSGTSGGLLAFTGSSTLASTAAGSTNQILLSAGTSSPIWSTATYPATTTANQLLYSSGTNAVGGLSSTATGALVTSSGSVPSFASGTTANRVLRTDGTSVTFSQVAAATDVSGQLGISNGGTGQSTKAAAFDALSPMTTGGDLIYGGASGTATRLANGTAGYVLTSAGTTLPPIWSAAGVAPTASNEVLNLGLSASVGSNLLTVNLVQADGTTPAASAGAVKIGFRNSTIATGQYAELSVTSSLSISTVATGATFGTVSAQAQPIYVYAINNAGTVELALAGNASFDEGTVQNTTAIGASSTSSGVLYSTTARTGVAVRLIGRLTVTEATAGTYATAPSQISVLPIFPKTVRSQLTFVGGNGFGSSSTKIRRFTSVLGTMTGSAFSHNLGATDATLGVVITINEEGLYGMTYQDCNTTGANIGGITVNSSQLTTSIYSLANTAQILAFALVTGGGGGSQPSVIPYTGVFHVGDLIRAQSQGAFDCTTSNDVRFNIVKMAN